MGLFSKEPVIKGDERQECLAYYEEEKKLYLLYEKVEQLFSERVRKYEYALFKARRAREEVMDGVLANLEKIFEVTEYIHQAAVDIVKRKNAMRTEPSAALAMSSAFAAVYFYYTVFSDSSNIVSGSDTLKVQAQRERAKLSKQKFHNSLNKAWKEEKDFCKRIKLSMDETRRIVDNASIATAADNWLQELIKKCP
jgi:hypothetical protein